MRRLALIFGGPSVEHEVSLISARSVFAKVDRESFEVVPIGMTREWQWVEGENAESMMLGAPFEVSSRSLQEILSEGKVDVAFPLIHGTFGEDGNLQACLQSFGCPYVGCGVKASAVGMDKAAAKAVWSQAGLPVVPFRTLRLESWQEDVEGIKSSFDLPIFVKPADSGSSVGISKISSWEELDSALKAAFGVSRKIMVEPAVEGRELEVAVLGGYVPEVISVPGEIIPGSEFYDYDDKYVNNSAKVVVPAELPDEIAEHAQKLAHDAFAAIDACGMARVDLFLDSSGQLLLNEINTVPGFTPISMYPKLMELSGVTFTNLITKLADLACSTG